jgi:hypothetical protein
MSDLTFDDLIEKVILIGVTYVDKQDNLLDRKQWWGIVESASSDIGIRVSLKNSSDPCVLPPDLNAIRRAAPGEYRLKESGEIVNDPDFLTTWTCVKGGAET